MIVTGYRASWAFTLAKAHVDAIKPHNNRVHALIMRPRLWRASSHNAREAAIVGDMGTSSRIRSADAAFAAVKQFYASSRYAERRLDPDISDFTFGNPHELPL